MFSSPFSTTTPPQQTSQHRLFRFYDPTHLKTTAITRYIVYVDYTLILLYIYIISYPYDGVEFGHGHLFRSFYSRGYLLLVLQQYAKQMHYFPVWVCYMCI